MTALVICVALILDRLLQWHRDPWAWNRQRAWRDWLWKRGLSGGAWSRTGLLILPPVLLLLWLDQMLGGWSQGLLTLVVLLHAFGARDLYALSDEFIDACERDDRARAEDSAARLGVAGGAAGVVAVPRGLVRAALHQYLTPIFWTLILGPAGALLVRSCHGWHGAGETQSLREPLRVVLGILDWLPARMAMLLFGICGNFDAAWQAWRPQQGERSMYLGNLRQLEAVGLAAANAPALEIRHGDARIAAQATLSVRALLLRSLVVVFGLCLLFAII